MKRKNLIFVTLILIMILSLSLTACSLFGGGDETPEPGTEQGGNPGGDSGEGGNPGGGGDAGLSMDIIEYPTEDRPGYVSIYIDGEECQYEIPPLSSFEYEKNVLVEPTCTTEGKTKYFIDLKGKRYSFEIITEPLGHDFIISYVWSEDNLECKAVKTCKHDNTHIEYVDGKVDKYLEKEPTCSDKGQTRYVASFKDETLEKQIKIVDDIDIDPDAHDYDNVQYVWADDCSSCKAVKTCKYNQNHKIETTGTITHEIDAQPTCTVKGTTRYTVTFDVDWATSQTRIIADIPAIGHDYGETVYTWNNVTHVCKASRTCKNNQYHVETVTGTTTSEVVTPASCTVKGSTKYTITFNVDWAKEQIYTEQDIALVDHTYGDIYIKDIPTLTEKGSMYKKCSVCNTETLVDTLPEVNSENTTYVLDTVLVAPTSTTNGKGKYHFDFEGVTYTFESEIPREDLSYYYNKNYWNIRKNLDYGHYDTPQDKDNYYNELKTKYGVFDNKTLKDYYIKCGNLKMCPHVEILYNAITSATYDVQCIAGISKDIYNQTVLDVLPFIWTKDTKAFAKNISNLNHDVIIYDNFVFFEDFDITNDIEINNNLYIAFKTVERIKMVNDIAYSLDMKYLIKDCGNDQYDVILENCEHICSYAFNVTNINTLTIPATVKTIGSKVFLIADLIKNLTFAESSQLTSIGSEAFSGLSSVNELVLPNSLKTVAIDAFNYSHVFDKVLAPITAITALKDKCIDLTITNGTIIPEGLLKDSKNLEIISFADTIVSIGNDAFRNARKLNTVNFGSIKTIGDNAFKTCVKLNNVNLGSVTSIGKRAFSDCTELVNFTFNDVVEIIDDYAFEYTGITYVNLPASVNTFGIDPYRETKISFIIVPKDIPNFSDKAFESIIDDKNTDPHFKVYFKEKPVDTFLKDPGFKPTFSKYLYSVEQHTTINDIYADYWYFDVDNKTPKNPYYNLFYVHERPDKNNEYLLSRYFYASKDYTDYEYDLILPTETEDGYPITGVGSNAFCSSYIKSITFNDNIDYIGSGAFKGLNINDIVLPKSIKYIGDYAFTEKGWEFDTITFEPKTNTTGKLDDLYIGIGVFSDNLITEIVLPKANITLAERAFENNANLIKVASGGPVTASSNTFNGCPKINSIEGDASLADIYFNNQVNILTNINLTSGVLNGFKHRGRGINIGADVTYIKPGAFRNIDLDDYDFSVDPNNARYKSSESNKHCVIDTETNTLLYAQGSSPLPLGIKTIGPYSLHNKTGRIHFDLTVEKICDNALVNNDASGLVVSFSYPRGYCEYVYGDKWHDSTVKFSREFGSGYTDNPEFDYAINNNEVHLVYYSNYQKHDVVVPDTINGLPVVAIHEETFMNCYSNMSSIQLGANVKILGKECLKNTRGLKSIDLKNVEKIGGSAFMGSSITSLVIPDTVVEIGMSAFYQSKLSSVTFNTTNLKVIDRYCFNLCNELTSVNIPEGVERIESCAFKDCKKLTSVTLPSTLKAISPTAFLGCPLESITCDPKNQLFTTNIDGEINALVYVGQTSYEYIDYNLDNSELITYKINPNTLVIGTNNSIIPASDKVTSIAKDAFNGKLSNYDLVIPSNIKVIGARAFANNSFNSITLNEGLERIEDYGFMGSTIVTKSVIMPKTIKYCGENIFDDPGTTLKFKGPNNSQYFHDYWRNSNVQAIWNYVE